MNIGERIAEKMHKLWRGKRMPFALAHGEWSCVAKLINQEVAKENTEDSERLDWLERMETERTKGEDLPYCVIEYPSHRPFWGETFRQAIDAARGKTLGNETPASTDPVANREIADVINAARVMCEQYQLLCSIVSEIAAFKDVDWEQDEHEKAIQRFSRALAKLDVPLTSAPSQSSTLTEGKEENL
jgi:hypothetical protein